MVLRSTLQIGNKRVYEKAVYLPRPQWNVPALYFADGSLKSACRFSLTPLRFDLFCGSTLQIGNKRVYEKAVFACSNLIWVARSLFSSAASSLFPAKSRNRSSDLPLSFAPRLFCLRPVSRSAHVRRKNSEKRFRWVYIPAVKPPTCRLSDSRVYYCVNAADYTASLKTALLCSAYAVRRRTSRSGFRVSRSCAIAARSRRPVTGIHSPLGLQIYRVNTYLPISDRLVLRECRTIPLLYVYLFSAYAVRRRTSRSGFGSAVHVRSLHDHADRLRAVTVCPYCLPSDTATPILG